MILTTASIGFGTWLLDKIKDKGFDTIYNQLTNSDKINIAFIKSVDIVSEKLHSKYPEILGGRMEYFFKSDQIFRELIKLTFINSSINLEIISNSFDTETLPPNFILEFITELKNELLKDRDIAKILSDKELFILIYGISNEIETIAKNSDLALAEIKHIKGLLEQRIGDRFLFNDFLLKYSENAINNLSQVNFIGLGVGVDISKKITRKNLDDIFVKPKFKLIDNKFLKQQDIYDHLASEEDYEVTYDELFNYANKMVIIGNPGSGKSILIKSIICTILTQSKESFDDKQIYDFLPFRIELRKYLAYKKQNRGNIIKYLNSLLEEEYGIANMTEILLNKIFLENKSIIFFDGLDEIFKVEDKIDIKNDIENFLTSFPLAKSITTSRIIGYDEAKLNDEDFCEFAIQNFDELQMEEYLQKWYEKEEELPERRANEINGFLQKRHEVDNELVSNPLLLSLIVIIYRNTLALPESKLEIYQSCTKTLVEKWDASKKDLEINLDPLIYKKRENILADLAYWQYQQLSGDQINITFDKALNTVSSSIERLKITDDSESYSMAENFMGYAQKRSIYFENNFTHKTFLEYYSAYWIYSNIEKKNKTEERNLLIAKYINNPFWHIVLELLLNMIDKNQADNDMIDELIGFQIDKDRNSLPFILSTMNSYKNISQDCMQKSVNLAIDFILNDYRRENFLSKDNLHVKIYETIKKTYNNQENIKNLIINKLIEVESKLEYIDLLYCLYFEIDILEGSYLSANLDFIFKLKNSELFEKTILNNKFLFISSCYNIYKKEIKQNYFKTSKCFIDTFGFEEFFKPIPFKFYENYYLPMAIFFMRNQVKEENLNNFKQNIKILLSEGLNIDMLITFLIDEETFLTIRVEKNFIEVFNEEEDNTISLLMALIIFRSVNKSNFREISSGKKKESFILKISSLTREERVPQIFKEYNYKN